MDKNGGLLEADTVERSGRRPMIEQAILDRLISSLCEKGTPLDGNERPAVILRTDPKGSPVIDFPDELCTKIYIEFYSDPADGVFKARLD